jgi:hypothetical protein
MKEHERIINGYKIVFQRGRDNSVAIYDKFPSTEFPERPFIFKREIEMKEIVKSINHIKTHKDMFGKEQYQRILNKMYAVYDFGISIGLR